MRPRTVLVVHPEMLVAESITSALAAFSSIVPVRPATSAAEAEARADHAGGLDAAAIDERFATQTDLAARLRRRGARVVVIGGVAKEGDANDDDGDDGVRVPATATVAALAAALVPTMQPVRPAALSTQQTRVLSLVARGLTAKEVARQLGISPKTVEQHKARIFERLGVRNQAAAVRAVFDPVGQTTSWSGV
ncbi:MAG: helix-turn-helix transcriptional regulator [Actinomycetota bacterium]